MSKSNESSICRCLKIALGLSLLSITQSSVFANATYDKSLADGSLAKEGRAALEFYDDKNPDDISAPRLSNRTLAYPAVRSNRLRPLFELGDPFVSNGPIRPGIETPTGQMLQPWFLLYGSLRSALQSFDDGHQTYAEWANRLDLIGNVNLSGTERLVFALRPVDGQNGSYSGYNFEPNQNDGWTEDFNSRLTKLFFEGDLGEIFPNLDPNDSHSYDIGFSVGRQQLSAQDGILLNENIDAVGITRNSLMLPGVSNLRLTGIFGWNHINRGNNDDRYRIDYHSGSLFGLLTAADTALNNTVEMDLLHMGGEGNADAWYIGAGSTQRFGELNSTFRVNASIPAHNQSLNVGRGVLLLSQLSTAISGSDNNLYFNTFLNVGDFTSAARSPNLGSPLANLGLLYDPVGMGRYGIPLDGLIDNTIGATIGYQMFLGGIDKQLIIETGGRTSTRSEQNEGALGFGMRYQQAFGKRYQFRVDSFVAGKDQTDINYGFRTEWMVRF